ncbi:MAG: sigma-70 family RNA polymerase sigma factor [Planctomycetaceae bacterium]
MQDTRYIGLVQEAQSGCREAFGQLATQFESMVFSVVFRRLRNSAEAAEVTQEVLMRAMRKINQLKEPERFVGWLKRIAVRMSINRAVRRPRETMTAPELMQGYADSPGSPLEGILRTEQAHELHNGIRRLRRIDRETLLAFYFEGQSLKEMSDRFESPVGTIKRRLHTARHRLKEALGELQPA